MSTKVIFTLPPTTTLSSIGPAINVSNFTDVLAKWRSNTASFFDAAFFSVIVTGSLQAILITITNLILLAVILSSPLLRSRMRNQLVVSLASAHLIVGVITMPFNVDASMRRDWVHGCYTLVVVALIGVFVQNFVSVWGVVALLVHYIARMKRYDGPAWLTRLPRPGLLIALPWALALVVVVPLVFAGIHKRIWALWNDANCPFILQTWTSHLLNVLSFFLPAVVLIGLIVAIIVLYQKRDKGRDSNRKAEMGVIGTENRGEMESCWVHVLIAVLTVLLLGPRHVFLIIRFYIKGPFKGLVISSVFVHLLSSMAPFLLALALLLMLPDVRDRLVELVTRLPCLSSFCRIRSPPQAAGKSTVGPVAFTDLQDE